jgi:hypothetical protein
MVVGIVHGGLGMRLEILGMRYRRMKRNFSTK